MLTLSVIKENPEEVIRRLAIKHFDGKEAINRVPPQRPRFLSYDKRSVAFSAPVVNFQTIYIRARKAKKRKPRL